MVGFVHATSRSDLVTEEHHFFADLLPHGLLVPGHDGVVFLSTPRKGRPTMAVGCGWEVIPRNIEVLDEAQCDALAMQHEALMRALPVGAALQVLTTVAPSTTVPAWEAKRAHLPPSPLLTSQQQAIRQGFPHRDDNKPGRLRAILTYLTVRLPCPPQPAVPLLLRLLSRTPDAHQEHIAEALAATYRSTLIQLEEIRTLFDGMLGGMGHDATRLTHATLGAALQHSLDPLNHDTPSIYPEVSLAQQATHRYVTNVAGGWRFTAGVVDEEAQVLSLQRAMPQTYPGILCAPRAPEGSQPLALWETWQGPLTMATNIAIVSGSSEKARLQTKLNFAKLHAQYSTEAKELVKELEAILQRLFLGSSQMLWGRVHLVLWGAPDEVQHGVSEVMARARQLDLEFAREPQIGSTLFLQTLPLGFDPDWPRERFVQRARRLPSEHLARLMPLYGGVQGTPTPTLLYLNSRGEPVTFDPFDSATAAHMLVTGKSGAGKSHFTANQATQVLQTGGCVVIIDRLPSYKDFCVVHNGRYIQLDFHAPTCFNPFFGPLDAEHRTFIVSVLMQMASDEGERLSNEYRGVISRAVAYFARTWEWGRGEPHLSPFINEVLKTGVFDTGRSRVQELSLELVTRLEMYYGDGQYASFVDGPNTLQLDERLTVIEISQLSSAPDLQGIIFFILAHSLTQLFTNPAFTGRQKHFYADEVAFLLEHPSIQGRMKEIALTYRKLIVCAMFIAQQAMLFESPVGQAIRAQTHATLFLQQDAAEIDELKRIFKLTDVEEGLLKQARSYGDWSSAYLRLPNATGGMIRLIPDAFTKAMLSQHPKDRAARQQALEATAGEMTQAIQSLVEAQTHA